MKWSDYIKPVKTVTMGKYWQSNDDTKEPIEWIVLREEPDRMYVISQYCLDYVPYCDDRKNIRWERSNIRKWLNEYFYDEAFSSEEKGQILCSDVITENGGYSRRLDSGRPVQDYIFLPSIAEAIILFNGDSFDDIRCCQKRFASPTPYASQRGAAVSVIEHRSLEEFELAYWYSNAMANIPYWVCANPKNRPVLVEENSEVDTIETRMTSKWFLRTDGSSESQIRCVEPDGRLSYILFSEQEKEKVAVRPAMWIKK